jgi:hypothetical protein
MTTYFYVKNGEKKGPVTKTALKGKIAKDTLIWKEGLKDWVKASELPELNDLFQQEPPPIPEQKTQQKAPPIPGSESQNIDLIDSVFKNAILLLVIIVAAGFMEYKELESNKFYGSLLMAMAITTYYLLKRIKIYLNKGLNFIAANTDLNILIVTSIILGVAAKLFVTFEKKLDAMETIGTPIVVAILVVFIALILNWIYFYKLGKKLSKIENIIASKISKFAYATVISYFLTILLFIIFDLDNTNLTIVGTIISALPLVYLIFDFKETDTVLA